MISRRLAYLDSVVNSPPAREPGAYGYSNEFPVERFWRNSRGAVIYEGTKEVQQIIQAEYALGYRTDGPLRCELPPWPYK